MYMNIYSFSDQYSICRIGKLHKIVAKPYVQYTCTCTCMFLFSTLTNLINYTLYSELNLKNAKELFNCVMPMADIVIPQVETLL